MIEEKFIIDPYNVNGNPKVPHWRISLATYENGELVGKVPVMSGAINEIEDNLSEMLSLVRNVRSAQK